MNKITKEMDKWILENYQNHIYYQDFYDDFQIVFDTPFVYDSFRKHLRRMGGIDLKGKVGKRINNSPQIGRSKLPKEAKDFVKKNYPAILPNELAIIVSNKFGIKCCDNTIRRFLKNEGLKIDREVLTKEMQDWIQNNYQNYEYQEPFYDDFQKVFNTKIKLSSFTRHISLVGITHFNKGKSPRFDCYKRLPIGTERLVKGRVYIKVKDVKQPKGKSRNYAGNENWRIKSHVVWEEHNGKIPKGYTIIHLDGKKHNDNIENLTIVPEGVQGAVGHDYGKVEDVDAYRAMLKLKTLEREIKERN